MISSLLPLFSYQPTSPGFFGKISRQYFLASYVNLQDLVRFRFCHFVQFIRDLLSSFYELSFFIKENVSIVKEK